MTDNRSTDIDALANEISGVLRKLLELGAQLSAILEQAIEMRRQQAGGEPGAETVNVDLNELRKIHERDMVKAEPGGVEIRVFPPEDDAPEGKENTQGMVEVSRPQADARKPPAPSTLESHVAYIDCEQPGSPPGIEVPGRPIIDHEPAPAKLTRKEIVLNHYAETGAADPELASHSGSALSSIPIYLGAARKLCDPRVARGDSIRQEKVGLGPSKMDDAAYRRATQPKTVEPAPEQIGKAVILRVIEETGMVDGPDDEVPIRSAAWRSLLRLMSRQGEFTEEWIRGALGDDAHPDIWRGIRDINLALAKTGLVIHSIDGGPNYQLRKLI